MRTIHRVALGVAALALPLVTACGPADDSGNGSADSGKSTTSSGSTDLQMPGAPAGTWQAAGDLCKIITGDVAAQVLGYSGTLTTEYSRNELPAVNGVDACVYTDTQAEKGTAIILNVASKVTDETWTTTLQQANSAGTVRTFTVNGVDAAIYIERTQALVKKGDLMASSLNSSLGKFDPAGLVKLTALATNTVVA
jgi:hypothetical protein